MGGPEISPQSFLSVFIFLPNSRAATMFVFFPTATGAKFVYPYLASPSGGHKASLA
jgi:hypothetical protein